MSDWNDWSLNKIIISLVSLGFIMTGIQVGLFHYRGNFRHPVMWGPVVTAPLLAALGFLAVFYNKPLMRTIFNTGIRAYKGSPVMALTQDFYETDPENDFARGYAINSHGFRPLQFIRPITRSIFVASGGANPTLTVMALANRTADYIIDQLRQNLI